MENNNISLEQPERPGWVFPGDIVELYAPEDDDLFHTDEETSSLDSEEVNVQTNQQQTSEKNPIMGDIPNRLSPVRNYVPAGAEEVEPVSSQETTSEPEATVEDGLADFFSNPSHRATNPVLQQPVEAEEDWGDITPVEVPEQPSTPQPNQTTRFEKRQRYLQRRRERRSQNRRNKNQDSYYSNYFDSTITLRITQHA